MAYFWFLMFALIFFLFIQANSKVKQLKKDLSNFNSTSNESANSDIENSSRSSTRRKPINLDENNYDDLDWDKISRSKMESHFLRPKKDVEDKAHFFYGKKVVITGDFENFAYRDEMAELLWDVGADIDTTITKRTNYVIKGSEPGWRKMEQAEEYGIEIITEDQFLKIFPDYESPYL